MSTRCANSAAPPDGHDPGELLTEFTAVLSREYGEERVELQDRSVKVEFPDFDLHVDAVPARPSRDIWEVPDPSGNWQETNPEHLGTLTTEMNESYDGRYVPLVKLIRQARRANLGKRPGGLYLELLVYHSFDVGLENEGLGCLFTSAMRSIATQLGNIVAGGELGDPTRPGEAITAQVTDGELATAASTFDALATKAEEALAEPDRCRAAKMFRDILGKNADDEWVFEMPADCYDDGTTRTVSVLSSGDRHVPAGDGRFA